MSEFLRWEWMIFLVPLALAGLLGLSAALGIGMDGAGDVGEIDAHTDVDLHHDVDLHQDADWDHGSDLPGDAAEGPDADTPPGTSLLEVLGVGQAPIAVLALCLTLFWAVLGLMGNALWGVERAVWSVALAAFGTLPATAGTARLVGRWLPTHQSFSVTRSELIGVEGTAIYPVTETAGTVRLYDRLHTLRQLDSRTRPGATPLPEGAKVVVCDYDPQTQIFIVCRPEEIFEDDATRTATLRRQVPPAVQTPAEAVVRTGEDKQ